MLTFHPLAAGDHDPAEGNIKACCSLEPLQWGISARAELCQRDPSLLQEQEPQGAQTWFWRDGASPGLAQLATGCHCCTIKIELCPVDPGCT